MRILSAALRERPKTPQGEVGEGGAGGVAGESKDAVPGEAVVLIEAIALIHAAEGKAMIAPHPVNIVVYVGRLARESSLGVIAESEVAGYGDPFRRFLRPLGNIRNTEIGYRGDIRGWAAVD